MYQTTITVRIGDINYGGHLGHDRLITLLHQIRLDYLHHLGASELDCFGVGLIMRKLSVDYLGEAFLNDELTCQVWVSDRKPSRFMLNYVLTKADKKICEAQTLMVGFDYGARKVVALPPEFFQAVEA